MPEQVVAGANGAASETVNPEVSTGAEHIAGEGGPQGNANPGDNELPKKKGGFQRKIERLEAENADKAREAEYWRKAALGTQQTTFKPAEQPKDERPKAPKLSDFSSLEEFSEAQGKYVDELSDWKVGQAEKAQETKRAQAEQQRTQQSEHQKATQRWQERETAVAKTKPDYEEHAENAYEVLNAKGKANPQMVPTLRALSAAVLDSDMGPELLYEIGKDTELAEKLAAMSPLAAIRELGKLEARLASNAPPAEEGENAAKQVSGAPKPAVPLAKPGAAKAPTLETLPYKEFVKAREAHLKRKP